MPLKVLICNDNFNTHNRPAFGIITSYLPSIWCFYYNFAFSDIYLLFTPRIIFTFMLSNNWLFIENSTQKKLSAMQ